MKKKMLEKSGNIFSLKILGTMILHFLFYEHFAGSPLLI